jgi:three-Cys-motif partner protein
MTSSDDSFLRGLPDDHLYLPPIKAHSLEKILRHNYYTRLFSTGMKAKWPQRAYIGLYSGAGRARVEGTGEIVETTAMSVLRLPDPFSKYIFVDNDSRCTSALSARVASLPSALDVSVMQGDVDESASLVMGALPAFGPGNGLLSFCFVDPFAANLRFETIRTLGQLRMDFLILLMLGWDARVNFQQYYRDTSSTRIGELIDCPDWREQWDRAQDKNVIRFLLGKFDTAMVRIGYRSCGPEHYHPVTAHNKAVLQYVLAFYSKHPLGQRFWEQTLAGSRKQLQLPF